ncbi:unnamed protein product [Sphagnum troendelagicum]
MMQIVFRNTKLSFTKHWGVDKSASIIRHFCAVGHSVPDSVRKVIGLGIPTSSQEKNKGHYLNLDDFQEVYEDSMLIHHGEMMALILHGFVPSSEAPEHVRMLGDLFQYGGTMLRTCSPKSRMALFGHRFCCGDLTMDRRTCVRNSRRGSKSWTAFSPRSCHLERFEWEEVTSQPWRSRRTITPHRILTGTWPIL